MCLFRYFLHSLEASSATLIYAMCRAKLFGLTFIKGDMKIFTYVESSFGNVVTDKHFAVGQITYLSKSLI